MSTTTDNNNNKLIESKLIGHKDTVLSVDGHSNKEILASGSDDCTVRIWDLNTNKSIKSIVEGFNGNAINNVLFDQDNTLYCSYDNVIVSFDLRQSNIVLKEFKIQYKFNSEEINQLSFDSKFQYIAACDDSGETKIIDITKNKLIQSLDKKHTNITTGCLFRPNSKNELITGSMDFSIIHWDFLKGKVLHKDTFKEGALPQNIAKKKQQATTTTTNSEPNQMLNPPFVTGIDCSNNSKHVAISMGDGNIVINEISSFKQYLKIESIHNNSSITQVHYPKYLENNYDRLISVGNYDKKIILWDVSEDTNEKVNQFTSNQDKNNSRIKLCAIHDEKINTITTTKLKSNSIFVADMSNDLKILTIQQ